jgi:hypothetical protein
LLPAVQFLLQWAMLQLFLRQQCLLPAGTGMRQRVLFRRPGMQQRDLFRMSEQPDEHT